MTRVVQRTAPTTHSATLNVAVRADGKLSKKLYVVLHEVHPPRNFSNMTSGYPFLTVRSSHSGKLDTILTKDWMIKSFLRECKPKSVLVLDSWSGYNCLRTLKPLKKKKLELVFLPPGSTSELQPLDLYCNMQLKDFFKKFSDKLRISYSDFIISRRGNFLSLLNLMYNQFQAKIFEEMFKEGWYKAGLIQTHPQPFRTPATVCFDNLSPSCTATHCKTSSILRCAHCSLCYCLTHILNHYH